VRKFKIFILIISTLTLVTCKNGNNDFNSGRIEYDITYPCLEKNHESLLFLLPKKMIMTFNENQYENEFIFPTKGSSLGLVNDCNIKNVKLIFGLGNNKKYTSLDSNSIYYLLDNLPKYEILESENVSFNYLDVECKELEVQSLKNDSTYKIKVAQNIEIKDVNWCTPFHEIEKVLLEYSIEQYGMEMHFSATQISKGFTTKEFNTLGKEYLFLETKKYLTEIKSMLSIFKCID
jgi:hypothetical protein